MNKKYNRKTIHNTRAYPGSDVGIKGDNNARAYPQSDGKVVDAHRQNPKMRIATWNVGSMTGRSAELSEVLLRRRVNICCIQETKWKESKARNIGNGYKLIYNGTTVKQNGVGIVIDWDLQERTIEVKRISDRIMAIKFALDNQPCMNVISAYAPQVGCSVAEKQSFWDDLNDLMQSYPPEETKYVAGDLNGHVGASSPQHQRVHGGQGYGSQNAQGADILDFATTYDMAEINTFFKKPDRHKVTYKSGGSNTQIDYILADRSKLYTFRDCKIIPGEPLTSQHRLLVADFIMSKNIKAYKEIRPRIRWHRLSLVEGEHLISEMNNYINAEWEADNHTADTMWNRFQIYCTQKATDLLGVSKGQLKNNKKAKWWQSEVEAKVKTKKDLFKAWQQSGSDEDLEHYRIAKKIAKREVACAVAYHDDDFYSKLEKAKDDRELFRTARLRTTNSMDVRSIKYIKSKEGQLLTSNSDINARWHEYYSQLLNETHPCEEPAPIAAVEGPIQEFSLDEVELAIRKMSNNKATGPDEIPVELWKRLGETGTQFLTCLFNKIIRDGMPAEWRKSFLVPFYKNKGDIRLCENYRAVKLMSHTLKIWERVINNRLVRLTSLSENQCGFVSGKSTTDALHCLRILLEKRRDMKKDVHLAFIDLEKAFDRVPRQLIYQSLRAQKVPEYYVNAVANMYFNVSTKVRSPAGTSDEFEVGVGVHQGSALSPLLFNLVMEHLTASIQKEPPWDLLYADDIVLIRDSPVEIEEALENWRCALETAGLKISRQKTEYMRCCYTTTDQQPTVKIQSHQLKEVDHFKYLGSVISSNGTIDADIAHRVSTGWMKWRQLSGVLCDSRMPVHVKGRVYKTAVRPALIYGAECWPIKKAQVQKAHTTEMRMLRWAGGVTLKDRVRNEHIRGSFKIRPIEEKLSEARLRWYGHVMRRPKEHMIKQVLHMNAGPKKRGRPLLTWMAVVNNDLKQAQVNDSTTQNRNVWRRMTRRADPN